MRRVHRIIHLQEYSANSPSTGNGPGTTAWFAFGAFANSPPPARTQYESAEGSVDAPHPAVLSVQVRSSEDLELCMYNQYLHPKLETNEKHTIFWPFVASLKVSLPRNLVRIGRVIQYGVVLYDGPFICRGGLPARNTYDRVSKSEITP